MANLSSKQQFLASSVEQNPEISQVRPPGSSDGRMKNENVAELVRYLQTQNGSPQASQSSGARDIFKAGQRRLRQLAQRPKKDSDPKSKEDDASRHLRALQREGFLQTPTIRGSGPKKSMDSSRSVSNFSTMSSSRRDVESIGQPWLERQNTQDSLRGRLSSLDLSDLTTLVSAAVKFDDKPPPPPYQPTEQPSPPSTDEQRPGEPSSSQPTKPLDSAIEPKMDKEQQPSTVSTEVHDRVNRDANATLVPTTSHSAKTGPTTTYQKPEATNNEEKSKEVADEEKKADERKAEPAPKNKSPGSNGPSPAPSLKLFPDTMPPRISSKAAWRISNCRLPVPNAPSPAPEAQQSSSTSAAEPQNGISKPTSSARPSLDDFPRPNGSISSASGKPSANKAPSTSSKAESSSSKNKHRPTSLQMNAINSFPLPAPSRPLPSLPGSAPTANPGHKPKSNSNGRIHLGNGRPADLPSPPPSIPSPLPSPREFPSTNSTDKDDRPSSNRTATPFGAKSDSAGSQTQQSPPKTAPSPPASPQLVRMRQSRAERVRALKLKDMSASRLYLTGSESPRGDRPRQSFDSPQVSPRTDSFPKNHDNQSVPRRSAEERQKNIASALPSPPPAASLPLDPPGQYFSARHTDKRHCTSPAMPGATKSGESSRSPQLGRSSSTRSASVRQAMVSKEQNAQDCLDSPLPSSDDECIGSKAHQFPPRPRTSKRRKAKPAAVDTAAAPRIRKASSSVPLTPRDRDSQNLDKLSPRSQGSQSSQSNQANTIKLLEGRIAQLERQNKILQAALQAALDADGKQESTPPGMSTSSSVSPSTASSRQGTSFSSTTIHSPRSDKGKLPQGGPSSRKDSWTAAQNNSVRNSFETSSSRPDFNASELEDIIAGFEFGWTLDVSSHGPGAATQTVPTR